MGIDQGLLRQLYGLSPTEWSAVSSKMVAFHQLGGNSVPVQQVERKAHSEDYLRDGMIKELQRRGLVRRNDTYVPPSSIPKDFDQRSTVIRDHIEKTLHGKRLNAAERAALGQLMARALADYLESQGTLVCPKSLFGAVGKTVQALDASFPGYLQAGVLPFCWQDH